MGAVNGRLLLGVFAILLIAGGLGFRYASHQGGFQAGADATATSLQLNASHGGEASDTGTVTSGRGSVLKGAITSCQGMAENKTCILKINGKDVAGICKGKVDREMCNPTDVPSSALPKPK